MRTDSELTIVIPATRVKDNLESLKHNLVFAKRSNFQVVVIHDIKDDESSDLLKSLLAEFKDTLLIEGHFGSAGSARNQALPHIKSEWIVFWDSDDLIISNNFLHLLNKTKKEESLIGIGNFETLKLRENKSMATRTFSKLDKNLITHPGIWRYIFNKKSIVDLEFSASTLGEDVQFICQALSRNPQITTTSIPIYRYKVNLKSQITATATRDDFDLFTLQSISKLILKNSVNNQILILKIFVRQSLSIIKRGSLSTKIDTIILAFGLLHKQRVISIFKTIPMMMSVLIRPKMKISDNKGKRLNCMYLHGGLGNQLFQISEALERFPVNEFEVISNSLDIFEKYNLVCPKELPIRQNLNLSRSVSHVMRKKAINLVLKLNYFIQMDSKAVNLLFSFLEKMYLNLLQKTLFWNYIIVSDRVALRNFTDDSPKPHLFIGYFQFKKNNISSATINYLSNLIEFNTNIDMEKFHALANDDLPLVVHVRLGDYKNFENLDVVHESYYNSAIEYMNSIHIFKKIWLFSNEPNRAINLLPTHLLEKVVVMEDVSEIDLDKFQLMRLGKAFIIPNSTFSWWAIRLSEKSDPIAIVPSRWFLYQKSPEDFIPSGWILI
jgi:glycosyltransferase involved in cell wall biosynthesis